MLHSQPTLLIDKTDQRKNGIPTILLHSVLRVVRYSPSPFLEVEDFDASGKDEAEEEDEANVPNGDVRQEALAEPKVLPQIVSHNNHAAIGLHFTGDVTQLGGYQPIQGPCRWRDPIVPYPIYR